MAINPYSLLHQNGPLNYKFYDDRGHITPNFEYSEGIRPTGEFMPAPYLPAVRFNKYFEEWFVLSGGKVVGMDSDGFIVPAGLKKDAETWLDTFMTNGVDAATDEAAADAAVAVTYTANDVQRGIKNAKGVAVVAGEPVVKSYFTINGFQDATQDITVSNPVGVSSYNYWAHPGGDGTNPAKYNVHNFNLQSKVAFVADYVLQLPIVADTTAYLAAPFAGMGSAIGNLKPGEFVSYDAHSNFVSIGYDFGAVDAAQVMGQVLEVDFAFPKDYLDMVRTRYEEFGELEKMPGTATGGLPDVLTYSGGTGLVTINLTTR